MKKGLKVLIVSLASMFLLAACVRADHTIARKAFAELGLEQSKTTAAEHVGGLVEARPGEYIKKDLTGLAEISFTYTFTPAELAALQKDSEGRVHFTRVFRIEGGEPSGAFFLVASGDHLFNVLANRDFPAFQYDKLVGGSGSPSIMKDFFANTAHSHWVGYFGNASSGNRLVPPETDWSQTIEGYFNAAARGTYTITMELVNLSHNYTVFFTQSRTVRVT
jgi:hypothetical protein